MSRKHEWVIEVSELTKRTDNPIRQIVEGLKIEPHPDKPMIALSIGDPTVFGNLKPPESVISAVVASIESGKFNGYAAACGAERARNAVATYSNCAPQDVFLCSGASSALDLCIGCLCSPGKTVLVPKPGFPLYRTLTEGHGGSVTYYNLNADTGWEADLFQFETAITENTCCIIINNPNNPCGSVWSLSHLRDILHIAARHYLPVIADEIYEHLVFPGVNYHSVTSIANNVPVLSCSGLTKRFLVPGWRIGWIVLHDPLGVLNEVKRGIQKLCQRTMGCNTIIQGALPDILLTTPESFYRGLTETLYSHAVLVFQRLSCVPGLKPYMPQGAMYMMVRIDLSIFKDIQTDTEFVEKMVSEQSVFLLPGACFQIKNFVRLVLAPPIPILEEACERIAQFCENHRRKRTKEDWLDN